MRFSSPGFKNSVPTKHGYVQHQNLLVAAKLRNSRTRHSPSIQSWTFEVFFQKAMSFLCGMIAVGAQDELISPVLFSLYVIDSFKFALGRVIPLRGRHGYHIHVPQDGTVH